MEFAKGQRSKAKTPVTTTHATCYIRKPYFPRDEGLRDVASRTSAEVSKNKKAMLKPLKQTYMVIYNQLLLKMSSTTTLIQIQTLTMFTLLISDHGLIVDLGKCGFKWTQKLNGLMDVWQQLMTVIALKLNKREKPGRHSCLAMGKVWPSSSLMHKRTPILPSPPFPCYFVHIYDAVDSVIFTK